MHRRCRFTSSGHRAASHSGHSLDLSPLMSNLGTLLGDLINYNARFPPPSRTFRTVSSHPRTPSRSDRYSGVAHVPIDSLSAFSTFPLNHYVSPVHGSQSLHGGLRSHGGSKICCLRCCHTSWLFCIASGMVLCRRRSGVPVRGRERMVGQPGVHL